MRVPDAFLRAVTFIGCRITGNPFKGGTAFFIGSDDGGAVVTARHNIEAIRNKSDDGKVLMWLNRLDGGAEPVESSTDEWEFHPDDPTADVAVLTSLPALAAYDHGSMMADLILTDEVIADRGVGIGDDLFVPGLFVPHSRTTRNEPILRVGHVAALPDEQVDTEMGPMMAYLAELRSIGGLSGSPVFVHFGLWRTVWEREEPEPLDDAPPRFMLLGLMHGHYDVKAPFLALNNEAINMGIGIVAPGQKIKETLTVALDRKKKRDKESGPTVATPDSAWKPSDGDYARADFLADLLKVTRPEPRDHTG
jgi:hypothetical protein